MANLDPDHSGNFTIPQACQILGLSYSSLTRWAKRAGAKPVFDRGRTMVDRHYINAIHNKRARGRYANAYRRRLLERSADR